MGFDRHKYIRTEERRIEDTTYIEYGICGGGYRSSVQTRRDRSRSYSGGL